MVATTLDAFALTIFKDSISLPAEKKAAMVSHILQSAEADDAAAPRVGGRAWTGDTKGHEFLFRNPLFSDLSAKIGEKLRDYVTMLGIDCEQIDFFYQRSWATVTQQTELIAVHSHEQSNISFAYYLLKPENSGDIQFSMREVPNEFSPKAFGRANVDMGFIRELTLRNTKAIDVEAAEDDIVIFPSKTQHATQPNQSGSPRISISGDVTLMLKDSTGHEHMMPNFSHWQQF